MFISKHCISTLDSTARNDKCRIDVGSSHRKMPSTVRTRIFLRLARDLTRDIARVTIGHNRQPTGPLLLVRVARNITNRRIGATRCQRRLSLTRNTRTAIVRRFIDLGSTHRFANTQFAVGITTGTRLRRVGLTFRGPIDRRFTRGSLLLTSSTATFDRDFLLNNTILQRGADARLGNRGDALQVGDLTVPIGGRIYSAHA